MNTHTIMFVLLVFWIVIRGAGFAAGKLGKPGIKYDAAPESNSITPADTEVMGVPMADSTYYSTTRWREEYGNDMDWAEG